MKVSVVMSVYNDSKWLESSINSVLNQTFKDFEFIIVDDASNDGSSEIITKYFNQDSRIKVIHNSTNKGLSYSLNKGIQSSTGEYIARMDADDICHSYRFEKQVNFLDRNKNIGVLGGNAVTINLHNIETGTLIRRSMHKDLVSNIWTETPFIHPTVMFRKKIIEMIGYYDENYKLNRAEDTDYWLRCRSVTQFHNLDIPLIKYRVNPNKKRKLRNYYCASNAYLKAVLSERKNPLYFWYIVRPYIAYLKNTINLY